MAVTLPPPPTQAASGDFAWLDWYNQLYSQLSITGAISWVLVDKAGSSIADLQDHDHASLSNILGGGSFHLSNAQYTYVSDQLTNGIAFFSSSIDPTAANIPAGHFKMYKNTTSGLLKLWANDGGTLKSITLT